MSFNRHQSEIIPDVSCRNIYCSYHRVGIEDDLGYCGDYKVKACQKQADYLAFLQRCQDMAAKLYNCINDLSSSAEIMDTIWPKQKGR